MSSVAYLKINDFIRSQEIDKLALSLKENLASLERDELCKLITSSLIKADKGVVKALLKSINDAGRVEEAEKAYLDEVMEKYIYTDYDLASDLIALADDFGFDKLSAGRYITQKDEFGHLELALVVEQGRIDLHDRDIARAIGSKVKIYMFECHPSILAPLSSCADELMYGALANNDPGVIQWMLTNLNPDEEKCQSYLIELESKIDSASKALVMRYLMEDDTEPARAPLKIKI